MGGREECCCGEGCGRVCGGLRGGLRGGEWCLLDEGIQHDVARIITVASRLEHVTIRPPTMWALIIPMQANRILRPIPNMTRPIPHPTPLFAPTIGLGPMPPVSATPPLNGRRGSPYHFLANSPRHLHHSVGVPHAVLHAQCRQIAVNSNHSCTQRATR